MKKKVITSFIILLILLGSAFAVDYNRIKKDEKPIFSKEIAVYKDGGSTEYLGLGYKIIKYADFMEDDGAMVWRVQAGPFFMRYNR